MEYPCGWFQQRVWPHWVHKISPAQRHRQNQYKEDHPRRLGQAILQDGWLGYRPLQSLGRGLARWELKDLWEGRAKSFQARFLRGLQVLGYSSSASQTGWRLHCYLPWIPRQRIELSTWKDQTQELGWRRGLCQAWAWCDLRVRNGWMRPKPLLPNA